MSWHYISPEHTFLNGIDGPDLCWETSVSKLTLLLIIIDIQIETLEDSVCKSGNGLYPMVTMQNHDGFPISNVKFCLRSVIGSCGYWGSILWQSASLQWLVFKDIKWGWSLGLATKNRVHAKNNKEIRVRTVEEVVKNGYFTFRLTVRVNPHLMVSFSWFFWCAFNLYRIYICVLNRILHKKRVIFIQLQEFPILPNCFLLLCQKWSNTGMADA